MLDDLFRDYALRFQIASSAKRLDETLRLLDEMKRTLDNNPPETAEIVRRLEKIASDDGDEFASFVLVAAWSNLSCDYCPALCRILELERCNGQHEQAVELLAEVGDARAIPSLTKAVDYRWSYDEWLNVPRKALQALFAIGTPESLAVIRHAAGSSDDYIRGEAESLLRRGSSD